jgi:hypothetical protein
MSCSDSGRQPSVLDEALPHPRLDALDEHAVLRPDLRIEREGLLDPRLVRVCRDEVVEEAVRLLGSARDDRPDREVRPARHHVDHRAGEEEVELSTLDLARRVVRAAWLRPWRAVLRHAPAARLEQVRVDGHVHDGREPGVRGRAVVALEEVLGGDLPVALELGLGALEEASASRSIPASAIRSGMPSRNSSSGAASGIGVDEDERPPGVEPAAARGRARATRSRLRASRGVR